MTTPARIGIDCRLGGLKHAGIGRYISELVRRMVVDTDYTWVLFCHDRAQAHELIGTKAPSNVEVIVVAIRHYSLAEQTQLPRVFSKANLDLLHVPHFNVPLLYRGKFVVTVHDLLWHSHTGSQVTTLNRYVYWIKYLGYRLVTRSAITRASEIFVPSQAVADTLLKKYPTTASRITITREGIASTLAALAHKHTRIQRNPRQLLYVGSLYPHKNVDLIIRALAQSSEHQLVIVSARSVFRKNIESLVSHLGVQNKVNFIDHASDSELAHYYAASAALIQPSFSEGFGLTGLEALAFETPVIASDIPVFREIYQDAALYIDPTQPKSLLQSLDKLSDSNTLASLAKNSRRVSAQFDWDTTTTQTLSTYSRVLAHGS